MGAVPDTSPSALIVRLDAIGDAVALVPLIHALRSHRVKTAVLLRPQNAGIFSKQAVNAIEVAGFALRDGSAANRAAIASNARSLVERYDIALIATEDPAGYVLAREGRIARRIGFENGWGKPFKTLWVRRQCTQTIHRAAGLDVRAPHECEVLFALGRPLIGLERPTRDPAQLRQYILDGPAPESDRVVMQVTDKWVRLGATLDAVGQLAYPIAAATQVRFVAAQSEGAFARRFAQATDLSVEQFASIETWKIALGSARALVAPDSGAIHVAGMVGTPTVAVFGSSNFWVQSARWAPWAAPYRAVRMQGPWPVVAADALRELLSAPARSARLYKG